jgi:two-component system, sensor histidine kinase YesM
VVRGTATAKVISNIVQFRNIAEPDKIIGQLFINIYLNYFEKNIRLNDKDYDAFFWFNHDETLIYQKNSAVRGIQYTKILPKNVSDNQKTLLIERKNGYFIINRSLSNGWILLSFTSNQKLLHRISFIFYFFLGFTLISLALIIIIVLPIILKITNPITELTKGMRQVAEGNLDMAINISSGDELEAMANGFNRMVVDLKNHISESVEYEKTKRKMEYDILLSQINPHFIYNILNTVIYLARKQQNHDIANLVGSFIRILQDGIKVGGEGLLTTVNQEIEIVNHYVTIQQYRYRERFELIWQVAEELLKNLIPKTLIQPLVENALYHGICPKEGPGKIIVSITKTQNDLVIMVEDDGIGMEQEMIQKLLSGEQVYEPESKMRSIGIANIRDRIRYLFGENYGVTIKSTVNKGTRVTVTIPLNFRIV